MPEQQRAKFYAWLREQTDDTTAEFVMSCLAPAPLSDLVTKQHLETVLSAEFSAFALKLAEQREVDRKEFADQREVDRKEFAGQRKVDLTELAAQREADRRDARKKHWVLVGAAIGLGVEIAAAEAGWLQRLTDLLARAF